MKILLMVCGKTLKDDISKDKIREMTIVQETKEFLREQRLQWFGHMRKMDDERAPMKAKSFLVNGSKRDRQDETYFDTPGTNE